MLSLVKADGLAYVEIEKLSTLESVEENRKQLLDIIVEYDLKLMDTEDSFNKFCDRLSNSCDWLFNGTKEDFTKLQHLLNKY